MEPIGLHARSGAAAQACCATHALRMPEVELQRWGPALHVAWGLRMASPGDLPLQALGCCEGHLVAAEAQQHHIMAAQGIRR